MIAPATKTKVYHSADSAEGAIQQRDGGQTNQVARKISDPAITGGLSLLESLLLKVECRPAVGELKGHTREVGDRYPLMDVKNCRGAPFYLIARAFQGVSEIYEPAEVRRHSVPAAMAFLPGERETLTAQVTIEGRTFLATSPACVYLPPYIWHSYRILRGSGYYLKVVLAPSGDYNSVTECRP